MTSRIWQKWRCVVSEYRWWKTLWLPPSFLLSCHVMGTPKQIMERPTCRELLPVAIACLPGMGVNCFGKALPVPVKPSDYCNSSRHLDCTFMRYPEKNHPAELLWAKLWVLVTQSCPTLCDPMDCSPPGSMGFPRQGYWSGLPFPSPGSLPNPGMEPGLLHYRQTRYHGATGEALGKLWKIVSFSCCCCCIRQPGYKI